MESSRCLDILLVEDQKADVRLLQEALAMEAFPHRLHVEPDGAPALVQLRGMDKHELPDLILLDLGLPRVTGHEFLNEIKHDPELRRLPVIVLSGSKAEIDQRMSWLLRANAFWEKPTGMEGWQDLARYLATIFRQGPDEEE